MCILHTHSEHGHLLNHWKYGLAGLIISLWGGEKRVKHVGQGKSREQGGVLCHFCSMTISKRLLCSSGDRARQTPQVKVGWKGWDSLDGVECQHWEWHLGAHTSLVAELCTGPWTCSNCPRSLKLKHLSPPAFCPGHHSGFTEWAKHTQAHSPPKKRGPHYMCVYINTCGHTALPPSGLLTTKGGCKLGLGWVFSPKCH